MHKINQDGLHYILAFWNHEAACIALIVDGADATLRNVNLRIAAQEAKMEGYFACATAIESMARRVKIPPQLTQISSALPMPSFEVPIFSMVAFIPQTLSFPKFGL